MCSVTYQCTLLVQQVEFFAGVMTYCCHFKMRKLSLNASQQLIITTVVYIRTKGTFVIICVQLQWSSEEDASTHDF